MACRPPKAQHSDVTRRRWLRAALIEIAMAAALAIAFYLLVVSGALGAFAQWFGDTVASQWVGR